MLEKRRAKKRSYGVNRGGGAVSVAPASRAEVVRDNNLDADAQFRYGMTVDEVTRSGGAMTAKILFFLSMATAPLLGLPASADTTSQNVDIIVTHAAPPGGPLRVLASNPRYFATPDGKAVYLTGNHTWTSGVSFAKWGPFSFSAMVDYMRTLNVNFIRHWVTWFNTVDPDQGAVISPMPFNRSGVCCARDGSNKFDVTSYNQTYFDKLKADVEYASSKGMYIMPLLFNMVEYGNFTSWATDYWNGDNNINGTTTNYYSAVGGADPTTLSLQQAYLRKFLDTLANESNVLYEIANELDLDNKVTEVYDYQDGMANLIHSYETARGYIRHPVGIEYPGNSDRISTSPADFIIPYTWQGSPPEVFNFGKPALVDTDHWFGVGGGTDWWWTGFMNGNLMISMDDMKFTGLSGNLSIVVDPSIQPMVENRAAIRQTRTLTTMVDMTGMVPRGDLCSTGLGLADTSKHTYIIYASRGGSVTVNLSFDGGVELKARWLSTADGQLSGTTEVMGGSVSQVFSSPFSGTPAALVITQ